MPTLADFVKHAFKVGTDDIVIFDPLKITPELHAYGEPEAAAKLSQLELADLEAIGRRAHQIWSTFTGEHGPILQKAICLAVVEHVEGQPRELRRKRRQYPKGGK